MLVVCKFRCIEKSQSIVWVDNVETIAETVRLRPVWGKRSDGTQGNDPENEWFATATPSGECSVRSPHGGVAFEMLKFYYIDILIPDGDQTPEEGSGFTHWRFGWPDIHGTQVNVTLHPREHVFGELKLGIHNPKGGQPFVDAALALYRQQLTGAANEYRTMRAYVRFRAA
jgi:hypothetical protein